MAKRNAPARMWRESYVASYQDALARARIGAALLDDSAGPGWENRIDLDKLDILSSRRCILGQLNFDWFSPDSLWEFCKPATLVAGGFSCGYVLEMIALLFRPAKMIESYRLLTRAWKSVLAERRFQQLKLLMFTEMFARPARGAAQDLAIVGGWYATNQSEEFALAHSEA